jgi:CYTH domain-containing protein
MDFDQKIAHVLGFPKAAYTQVERERRWLGRATAGELPRELIVRSELITDLYVTGTRLRLREARMIDGSAARLRLSRKADVDARTRLITSIYLPEQEFAVLAAALPGIRIAKRRHRLRSPPGVLMSLDEFQDDLAGLVLLEAEFTSDQLMADFAVPSFAAREVTDDPRYGGGALAANGLPADLYPGVRPSAA